jgi:hypothetical protein
MCIVHRPLESHVVCGHRVPDGDLVRRHGEHKRGDDMRLPRKWFVGSHEHCMVAWVGQLFSPAWRTCSEAFHGSSQERAGQTAGPLHLLSHSSIYAEGGARKDRRGSVVWVVSASKVVSGLTA